ncbi:MAG: hypothetical protein KDA79_09245 [Planctomycetaceae bacterium]|nr:hypothetical protein [Planctomycetaceae bacterium]
MVESESLAPAAEYSRRLQSRREQAGQLEQTGDRLSVARGLTFLLFLGLVLTSLARWETSLTWSLLAGGISLFTVLVLVHSRIMARLEAGRAAVRHYEAALARLDDNWHGTGVAGTRYLQAEHLYAGDLDLFGDGSLFQRICTARTRLGEDTLAAWLCSPADAATVSTRQEAVRELRPDCDLREQLALLEGRVHDELDQNQLVHWAQQPARPVSRRQRVTAALLGVAAIVALAWWLVPENGRPSAFVLVLLLEAVFLFVHRRQIHDMARQADEAGSGLAILTQVMELIESREFHSPALASLRTRLTTESLPPSVQIHSLHRRIRHLNNCLQNQFFAMVAFVLCLPMHAVAGIERWRETVGSHIPDWLAAVGEFEALSSLAGYSFEKPEHPFPEVLDAGTAGPLLEAEALGHPLLPTSQCVRNDVSLGRGLQLLLVSGSNMSGKSTLLRTIGTNTVLALAGGPVCAGSLRLTSVQVGTAMRVHDSLQAGTSLFYAVIRRLKAVVELTDGERPLLFLLDEILQGTNSHDRRVGSEGVIRKLIASGAIGLVTTHDLALTEIVGEFGEHARNIHFEDHLVDGKMTFDYRIRPGVVQKSNALELMRMMGLDV